MPVAYLLVRMQAVLEARGAGFYSLAVVILAGIFGYLQIGPNVLWAAVLMGAVIFEFQKRLDQGLPLMQIAALVAVLQWTVGPAWAYLSDLVDYGYVPQRYLMYVGEADYFSFALPGTAAFVFGLLAVGSSVRQRAVVRFAQTGNFMLIGIMLLGIAWLARNLAASFPGGGLAFVFHLVSQVGYVGVLYFLFSGSKFRWPLMAVGLLPMFVTTAESAMFHDMLLWSALLFCYWYGLRKHSIEGKVAILIVALFFVFTIQGIKQNYRDRVWTGQEASLVDEALDFWARPAEMISGEVLASQLVRMNQGWIVSAVIRHVPDHEPFADGETLNDAIVAALFPRFLVPDKKAAGGQENFRRFTGLQIAGTTSMGISPLGEAYANYGRRGGIGMLLGFGLFFALFYALCLKWVVRHPDFLFWIPLIFYQALKAETEVATILNQLSKGAIIAFGLHFALVLTLVPLLVPPRRPRARPPQPRVRAAEPLEA